MNLYKKCTAKPYPFLVIDLLKRIQELIMTIADNTRDEKLQYSINREVAKISALSPGEIDKCEFLTSEEIFPSEQSRIIEQVKFTYSPLGKALEKLKTI